VTRGRRIVPVALAVLTASALTACDPKGHYPEDDPRSAVHQLLRASVGQANGQRACALLTEAARARMAESLSGTCRGAMDRAIVALPGASGKDDGGTGRAAEDVVLDAELSKDGNRATVTVRGTRGQPLRFGAVRLSEAERKRDTKDADQAVGSAPKSDWRVDEGAEQLVTETRPVRPGTPVPDQ
jgi:hypothetical protein